MSYVPLAVRTEFDFGAATSRIDAIVARAQALQQDAVGIADAHNTFALWPFLHAATRAGVRPVFGVRLGLLAPPRYRADWDGDLPELVLHATSWDGVWSLLGLTSQALLETGTAEPGVGLEDLANRRDILALDGGSQGPIARLLGTGQVGEARRLGGKLKELFGPERFWLQLEPLGEPRGEKAALLYRQRLQLAHDLSVPIVAVPEARYVDTEDADAFEVLQLAQGGPRSFTRASRAVASSGDWPMSARRRAVAAIQDVTRPTPTSRKLHFRTELEMRRSFRATPEAVTNTCRVAEQCHLALADFASPPQELETRSGRSPADELCALTERGACDRYGIKCYQDLPATTRDRISRELDVIREKKLASCFLVAQDVVRYARTEGLPVGPNRQWVAGSLVAYALGITTLDPLSQRVFESGYRTNLPGTAHVGIASEIAPALTIDIGHLVRSRAVAYVQSVLGRNRAVHIATLSRRTGRSLVRDIGVALQMPRDEIDRVTAILPSYGDSIRQARAASAELGRLYQDCARARRLLEVCSRLEGLPHHASLQAGGLLLLSRGTAGTVALQRDAAGGLVAQLAQADAELLGLPQLHLQAARHATILAEAVEHIPGGVNLETLPLDDEPTYRFLSQRSASEAPFFDKPAAWRVLRLVKPEKFSELVLCTARARSAPTDSGHISRTGPRGGLHPRAAAILAETAGEVAFTDQLVELAIGVAGYSEGLAVALERAVRTADLPALGRHRVRFLTGALERGFDLPAGEAVFDTVMSCTSRLQNRTECAAYALGTYWYAYLMAHHPVPTLMALLDEAIGRTASVLRVVDLASQLGIAVRGADVNASGVRSAVEAGAIRAGLATVAGISEGTAGAIVTERERDGTYVTRAELWKRLPHLTRLERRSLEGSGALEGLACPTESRHRGSTAVPAGRQLALELGSPARADVNATRRGWEGGKRRWLVGRLEAARRQVGVADIAS